VPKVKPADAFTCPHCNARFEQHLKFCGECGKPMKAVRA
jgi:predicted amidophosphoribosyltransferase